MLEALNQTGSWTPLTCSEVRRRSPSGGSTGSSSFSGGSCSSPAPETIEALIPEAISALSPSLSPSLVTRHPGLSSRCSKRVNTARYKTELCRSFQESGVCKYGDKCQFAHGLPDLRSVPRHPKYKTELCKTFHSSGLCPYGPRCHFVHNEPPEQLAVVRRRAGALEVSRASPLAALLLERQLQIQQLAASQQRERLARHQLALLQVEAKTAKGELETLVSAISQLSMNGQEVRRITKRVDSSYPPGIPAMSH